ncbi:MAG: hypothetical protein KGJ79_00825 [Alphaproteobacteria bacterium]|nr:hypothetical protein [Alphaproteobacteria bacterium]MDE2109656.1 hypothetical protein [Alphaproteobacteria bacterium]MDE2492357.1 hypothetical protein [Alphaproteobacteria bacterium]
MDEGDYRKFYHLESYLFGEVTRRFSEMGKLTAFDFFCIIIWKANRAKSKIARRLLEKGYDNLEPAVAALTQEIAVAKNPKARLKVLIKNWKIRLPMASAILTVLYPNDFSVYDVRVCDQLGCFHNTQNKTNFDVQWDEYQRYVSEVRELTPPEYKLRNKDRWLWGKSFFTQLTDDIHDNFSRAGDEEDSGT